MSHGCFKWSQCSSTIFHNHLTIKRKNENVELLKSSIINWNLRSISSRKRSSIITWYLPWLIYTGSFTILFSGAEVFHVATMPSSFTFLAGSRQNHGDPQADPIAGWLAGKSHEHLDDLGKAPSRFSSLNGIWWWDSMKNLMMEEYILYMSLDDLGLPPHFRKPPSRDILFFRFLEKYWQPWLSNILWMNKVLQRSPAPVGK